MKFVYIKTREGIWLNTEKIESIEPYAGAMSVIRLSGNPDPIYTKESPEDILAKIKEAWS